MRRPVKVGGKTGTAMPPETVLANRQTMISCENQQRIFLDTMGIE